MLKNIVFENYRCFENNSVLFKNLSVLVGKNNAGKSTITEALRMIAYAARKSTKTTYRAIPTSMGIGIGKKGIRIDVDSLKIDLRSAIYLYEDKIAHVVALFDNEARIELYVSTEEAYAILYAPNGKMINLKTKAEAYCFNHQIAILPQIGLIKEKERLFESSTTENYKETYLSSRHFRNEIFRSKELYWRKFKKMAEASWENLRIVSLDYNYESLDKDTPILLMLEVDKFMAEIGLVGSGLQMWLQIIWFLCRSQNCETIILDEPDVYMHPDLQLKLLEILKSLDVQVIIATHSVEIISAVSPANIMVVNKKKRNMKYVNSLDAAQRLIENIGSVQNLSLIRLGQKKKCLFVEGHDITLLSRIYQSVFPDKENIFLDMPYVELKGFCNLSEAFGTSKLLYGETENSIKSYCLLDRDYYSEETLENRKDMASNNHLSLHIWNRKEIENYLINLDILLELTKGKIQKDVLYKAIDKIVDSYESTVKEQIFEHKKQANAKLALSTIFAYTDQFMSEHWTSLDDKLYICPGKKVLADIMRWFQEELGISISTSKIINRFTVENIDEELLEVFERLETL